MGIETIPDRAAGQRMKLSWINNFRDVLIGHFVPRRISGSPRENYARLGSGTFPFDRLHAQVGDLAVGDVFAFHDYDENIALPQGWMFCATNIEDPIIINETNYDFQHSAGDWDEFIVSSPLSGLYLPDMGLATTYLVGKTGTLQSGSAPITKVGSNTGSYAHTHGSPRTTSGPSIASFAINDGDVSGYVFTPSHTHSLSLPSALSAGQDIRPSSTPVKYMMRIV